MVSVVDQALPETTESQEVMGTGGDDDECLKPVVVADFHSTGSWPKMCSAKIFSQSRCRKIKHIYDTPKKSPW
jgi:hypothetical protein